MCNWPLIILDILYVVPKHGMRGQTVADLLDFQTGKDMKVLSQSYRVNGYSKV